VIYMFEDELNVPRQLEKWLLLESILRVPDKLRESVQHAIRMRALNDDALEKDARDNLLEALILDMREQVQQ
jgi:hypothetical protein